MKVITFVAIVAIAMSVFETGQVSASNLFANLCTGTGCRGKDPIDQQCNGVSTASYSYFPDPTYNIYTELRKSTGCNSFWSRVTKGSAYSGNTMLSEALECANNDCVYTSTTPPPNPSVQYYYWPYGANKQTPAPGIVSWSDMVAGGREVCARGWIYTSAISGYVTSSSVYKSWACA
jgi:hypothetical protein